MMVGVRTMFRIVYNHLTAHRRSVVLSLLTLVFFTNVLLLSSSRQPLPQRTPLKHGSADNNSLHLEKLDVTKRTLHSSQTNGESSESNNKMSSQTEHRRPGVGPSAYSAASAPLPLQAPESLGIEDPNTQAERVVMIEVTSSERNVDVRLNNVSLMVEPSATSHRTRGLHVLVLNAATGDVMARRRFDTVLAEVYTDAVAFLTAVNPGRILVFASRDDISYNLHADLRYKLAEFGSQFIPSVGFRDQWAMVAIKGQGVALGEAHSPSPVGDEHGGPLFLRVDLRLGGLSKDKECSWPEDDQNKRRRQFCSRFEGYWGLCRCLQSHAITPSPSDTVVDLGSTYTVVMATHRPDRLYATLRSLISAVGVQPHRVVIFLENQANDEIVQLVKLFNFQVSYMDTRNDTNLLTAIGHRTINILDYMFAHFHDAQHVIFLEEDLQCSPDFFKYFASTRRLLIKDPSLFSSSAFNVQSHINTSRAVDTIYRVDTFSPLAFLLANQTFQQDIKPLWSQYAKRTDWDLYINRISLRGRECVVPDVNRVYHMGRDSLLVNSQLFEQHYKNLSFNPDPAAEIKHINRMYQLEYEQDLNQTLTRAAFVDNYSDICSAENMTAAFKPNNRTEVIFFSMDSISDSSTWKQLAQCFGLWTLDISGHHQGLWRFWMENKKGFFFHVVIIGVPFSKYSHFKPDSIQPYQGQSAVLTAPVTSTRSAAPSLTSSRVSASSKLLHNG